MYVCTVHVLKYNIHLAQSQATLVRAFFFAKQYSKVMALVQVMCSHNDQAISQIPTECNVQSIIYTS
jgi:hypothetical protein